MLIPNRIHGGRRGEEAAHALLVGPGQHRANQRWADPRALRARVDSDRSQIEVRGPARVVLTVAALTASGFACSAQRPGHGRQQFQDLPKLTRDRNRIAAWWQPRRSTNDLPARHGPQERSEGSRVEHVGGEVPREHAATTRFVRQQVDGFGIAPKRSNHRRQRSPDIATLQRPHFHRSACCPGRQRFSTRHVTTPLKLEPRSTPQ